MTHIAMFVGGPKDGDREERLGDQPPRYLRVNVARASMLRQGTADNDLNPLHDVFIYEWHPIGSEQGVIPVCVYAPANWSGHQLVLRLLEYYRPETDEPEARTVN